MKHFLRHCFLFLLLSTCHAYVVAEVPRVVVSSIDAASMETPITIMGNVVDDVGNPLSGVAVRWWEQERPEVFRNTNAPPVALSDTDGSFRFSLPSQQIYYVVALSLGGYESVERRVYGPTPSMDIVLQGLEESKPIEGTVWRDDSPTSGIVHVLFQDGRKALRIETDNQGNFSIPPVAGNWDYPLVYAESDGLLSPIRAALNPDVNVRLELQQPGSLEGKVILEGTGQALSGYTVEIFVTASSASFMKLTGDEAGYFVVPTLPPGPFTIEISHPLYGVPTEFERNIRCSVESGEVTTIQHILSPKTAISGQVVGFDGTPMANAWVGIDAQNRHGGMGVCTFDRGGSVPVEQIQTNSDGTFLLYTEHRKHTVTINSYHPAGGGAAEKNIYISGADEERKSVRIVLSGAIRVRGTVRDGNGSPLRRVHIGALETDENGAFDSGLSALSDLNVEALQLDFLAPRPPYGLPVPGATLDTTEPNQGYFLHQRVEVEPHPGQVYSLDVTLQRTRAITFSGTITDINGESVPGTEIALAYGENPNTRMIPKSWSGHSLLRSIHLSWGDIKRTPFNGALSDEWGNWSLTVPMETTDSLHVAYAGNLTSQSAHVRAEHPTLGMKQLHRIENMATLFDHTTLNLSFLEEKSSAANVIHVSVVDHEGKPLDGIEWKLRGQAEERTIHTDVNGVFTLSRDFRRARIVLQDEQWSVISPSDGGYVVSLRELAGYGESPYVVVLGKRGVVEVNARFPDGETADVEGAIVNRIGKIRYQEGHAGFVAENLLAGLQKIVVEGPDGYFREHDVEVPPGGIGQLEVVVPRATCTLSGRLIDSSGTPQGELEVSLMGNDYLSRQSVNKTGSFSFRVSPGTYVLEVLRDEIPCLADTYRELISVKPEEKNRLMDFLVTSPPSVATSLNPSNVGKLMVNVIGAHNTPLSGIVLHVEFLQNTSIKLTGVTDKTGYHTFDALSAGLYNLTISLGDNGREQRVYTIPLEPGATRSYSIDLGQGIDVSASVTGPNSLSRTKFTLVNNAAGILLNKESDASGTVNFANVPPGPGTLWCQHPARYDREKIILQTHEFMTPIVIPLARGYIKHTLDEHLAMIAQAGEVSVRKRGSGYVKSDFDGQSLQADALEDGTYEAVITNDLGTVATSNPIVIENGKTLGSIDWTVEESSLRP